MSVLNADTAERQISVKDFDVVLRKFLRLVDFVDDLSDADHFALVVAYRHAEYQIGLVARLIIDFAVESGILRQDERSDRIFFDFDI